MIENWTTLIHKLNHISLDLVRDSTLKSFTYQSIDSIKVHGKYFDTLYPNLNKQTTICLFHGLGAHLNTNGYQEIALFWQNQGFDIIGFDVRNQGGLTQKLYEYSDYGLYVSGIKSFDTYYYTHVYLDAYRLVDVAKEIFPRNKKIILSGGSQGGALALMTAILRKDVDMVLSDMPSCIGIEKLMYTQSGFRNFSDFFLKHPDKKETALSTLNSIDLMSYVQFLKVPTLLSSGDQDLVCPLEHTVDFFNHMQCEKSLKVYKGFGHGGYDHLHFEHKLKFIKSFLTE